MRLGLSVTAEAEVIKAQPAPADGVEQDDSEQEAEQ